MSQYFDLDKGKNVSYANDSSTSDYSSASPTSMIMSPAPSPESNALHNDFSNLCLPSASSPLQLQNSPYQPQSNQLLNNGQFCIDGSNLLNVSVPAFGNMYTDRYYSSAQQAQGSSNFLQIDTHMAAVPSVGIPSADPSAVKHEYNAVLHIAEQPVEKFRFRYKSEMHGTHGSLNGVNSKRTPKTFPEVELRNYKGPAVIRCSLFQTNLDSPHSHQLVVRKDDRDVCDPHDLRVSAQEGYVAQFINMGIIHTAKKYIYDELYKKKEERLVFQMGRRELSTKQKQELHQETERETKDMNLNQVRLCFEAFKIEENGPWIPIAAPVYSNPINNRKSAQTGELRIVRLSKPTASVMGNDELILLVEKVSKKNIKVRFFEENEDNEIVWEAYAKFRESDVHHQYAIVCQTPAYKDKDVDREVNVSIELIRPSDDERSYPALPFRYKPREAIASRKRRRLCSMANSGSSSSSGSAQSSFELPKPLLQHVDQTISQEFCREKLLNELNFSDELREVVTKNTEELENICLFPNLMHADNHDKDSSAFNKSLNKTGILQEDGHGKESDTVGKSSTRNSTMTYLEEIFKIFESVRRHNDDSKLFGKSRKRVEELFTEHALNNYNNDTLLHEVISQKNDNLKLGITTIQMMTFFGLQELANSALNADGDSGLHYACQWDRSHYIRSLLSLGCNPNHRNHAGNTALHLAVKEERLDCIQSFLNGTSVKLDLTLKNDDGLTPLHMAIRQNKYAVAKKLINHDRNSINVANTKDGNNALHMAVLEQNAELLVLILDAQDLTDILLARNAAGYTPLELARSKGNERCMQLLQEVYPEKDETAMTWIPHNVKEELDSSSDDESSETVLEEIKTEDIDIKMEEADVDAEDQQCTTKLPEACASSTQDLQALLNDKAKLKRLALILNEPSANYPLQPKWKELAKESQLSHKIFIWSNGEAMLSYIKNNSNGRELTAFEHALRALNLKSIDHLLQI